MKHILTLTAFALATAGSAFATEHDQTATAEVSTQEATEQKIVSQKSKKQIKADSAIRAKKEAAAKEQSETQTPAE